MFSGEMACKEATYLAVIMPNIYQGGWKQGSLKQCTKDRMDPDKFIQLYRMSVASFDGLLGFGRNAIMRGSINLAEWLGLG